MPQPAKCAAIDQAAPRQRFAPQPVDAIASSRSGSRSRRATGCRTTPPTRRRTRPACRWRPARADPRSTDGVVCQIREDQPQAGACGDAKQRAKQSRTSSHLADPRPTLGSSSTLCGTANCSASNASTTNQCGELHALADSIAAIQIPEQPPDGRPRNTTCVTRPKAIPSARPILGRKNHLLRIHAMTLRC